ncbi:MAG: N-6 DNA methylase [Thermoleophilaceae bacterium]
MESSAAVSPRRALGAYYTPTDIAASLTKWALRGNVGPVLDPSYGVCRFLTAALDVLKTEGATYPEHLLHGIDVDAAATAPTTQALLAQGARPDQFVHRDFFKVPAEPVFAAVLGNPPYVRHHWQREAVKRAAGIAMRDAGASLSRRASLWAPFVVHADRFVRAGGRMTMLLPGASIQADYANAVWEHLARRYAAVTLVRVGERIFPDALEETVVLLAGGRREFARATRSPLVAEVASFATLVCDLDADPTAEQLRKRARGLENARSNLTSRRLRGIAREHDASSRLGEVADIRIGTVTGANGFFVRTPNDDLVRALPAEEVVRVVPGSHSMYGATWREEDDNLSSRDGKRCRLLRLDSARRLRGKIAVAISSAEDDKLDERSHCQRRTPWWAVDPGDPPDAFLAYMAGAPRGLVFNEMQACCINGVHRVTWKVDDAQAYVLSTWTSLWALAVEQSARHYAGGVLKLEPGKAPDLPVIRHDDLEALDELDELLRSQGIKAARRFADDLVLRGTLGWSRQQLSALSTAADHLAQRRSPRMRSRSG